ncbi:putative late blight resistance protein homolog R1A-3 [Olea europaea var. sylvestris]|uniref:putative late blight resistance protein homolog R1A-3 n=1 Tax=Olea europaea var. sylvestris TaxID=158386 RepID=UPI000C1CFCBE|nr:putative late blight resistance protein homolog R1A-3 [Olea europaea var. sylvestris]
MAHAAVVSLMNILDGILNPCRNSYLNLDEKIFYFLKKSTQRHSSEEAKLLEIKIIDVAYHAEDVIELRTSYHFLSETQSPSRKILSKLSRKRPSSDLSIKLQKIIGEIDSIMEEMAKVDYGDGEHSMQPRTSLPSKFAPCGQTTMVGFDEDLKQIEDRLCVEQQSKLQIIPIVRMEESGKTTLDVNVYDDSFVTYHFDIHAWVTLSQHYSVREVLLGFPNDIVVLTHENRQESNEKLAKHLYKSLKRKRYLIVVDDIWSIEAWDEIKILFPNDNNGSRIIFTTRLINVANYANSFNTHHQMRLLNEEQSWNLFLEKVFGQENCLPKLEIIGQ